ncbi:MAG: M23 family metallopeptidase [Oscillibacter sp.]|nr:M23 family metallopeptidase [Oscillibacter sp.]
MKRTLLEKLGDFVLGKGFYIVLFLCVATIGISGYYLFRSASPEPVPLEPVTGSPEVVLPDTDVHKPQNNVAVPMPEKTDKTEQKEEPTTQQSPQAQTPQDSVKPKAAAVYTWPVKGEVLRGFSVETLAYDQTMGDWRTHAGMDIAAEEGFKVLCVSDGVVKAVFQDDLMGATVVVDHENGVVSTYSNLAEETAVAAGQQVDTGTVLGTVGGTAIAESGLPAHLHLEMTQDGETVDPTIFLPER